MPLSRAKVAETAWIPEPVLPTYSSGSNTETRVYTATSDATTRMAVGWRVRFTDSTVKYGIIHALTSTTITVYMGTDYVYASTSNPTAFHVSAEKAPIGFDPSPAKWLQKLEDTTGNFQATPTQNTYYNPGSLSFDIPIGAWVVEFEVGIRCQTLLTATSGTAYVLLSTSNSSAADSTSNNIHIHSQGVIVVAGAAAVIEGRLPARRTTRCTMAAKTTFFLITKTASATSSINSIGFDGGNTETAVRAVSAWV